MTQQTPGIPLGSWLADLPDERLIRLLELRPDLAQPPPGSVAALAARAQARQSIKAATDELDFLRLALIDALLVLHADTTPVPVAKLLTLIGERAPEADVIDALDDLKERALVWGDSEVRVAADAGSGLPWHPGQATLEDESITAEQITELIEGLDDSEFAVLEKLVEGSPIGRTRDAAPGAPPDRPVPRLLAKGLLRRIDAETVILPRQVGHVLRGEQFGSQQLVAPNPGRSTTTVADVDAAAAGAVIDLLRDLDLMLETFSAAPVAELRSGGLGVREVKRLAKLTGIDDARLGLILELAAAAGLIASGMPEPQPPDGEGPYWAPTVAADRFAETSAAERWHSLASTWLDLPARPSLIGTRGPDGKPYGALSDSVYSTAAPLDRRLLLRMLAELPPGTRVDETTASRALVWRRPRWAKRLQPGPVADLLEEAHVLGLVGRSAISTPGRALLVGDGAVVEAMSRALPEPIDHFLVQADLTVV
ncbi:MAG: DNA-binding protein, partial [Mycobacterium sp.]|nr:DNA-binding protein [Mycobacterium sp.]